MTKMNEQQAAKYCKENKFRLDHWNCGYILECLLQDVGIELVGSWSELEDILWYNN